MSSKAVTVEQSTNAIPVEVREAVCTLATFAVNAIIDRIEKR